MRVEVTGNDGSSLLNQVVPADAPYMLQLKKPNTGFTVKVTKIDGCNAGQSVQVTSRRLRARSSTSRHSAT